MNADVKSVLTGGETFWPMESIAEYLELDGIPEISSISNGKLKRPDDYVKWGDNGDYFTKAGLIKLHEILMGVRGGAKNQAKIRILLGMPEPPEAEKQRKSVVESIIDPQNDSTVMEKIFDYEQQAIDLEQEIDLMSQVNYGVKKKKELINSEHRLKTLKLNTRKLQYELRRERKAEHDRMQNQKDELFKAMMRKQFSEEVYAGFWRKINEEYPEAE